MRKRCGRKAKKWLERGFKDQEEQTMKIFVTGATGFIGSAIVPELIKAGHQVLGLTRSDAGARSLIAAGTGMGSAAPGQPATEDYFDLNHANPRKASEDAGASVAERGVNVSVVRLPQVHDTVKQGLIPYAVQLAREKGVSAYIGEGVNRWPAAHVLDVAHLYRLAFEKHEAGSRYNAVAEEGVPMRAIAEVIGRGLKVPVVSLSPEQAQGHFGWLAMFAGLDMQASI